MRYVARTDANHVEIKRIFEALGAKVEDHSRFAVDYDLLVHAHGLTMRVEIKNNEKPPSARKLTGNEQQAQANNPCTYAVICSEAEARGLLLSMREHADMIAGLKA